MSRRAYICKGVRSGIGRYGGSLSEVRADDLGAMVIRELLARNASLGNGILDNKTIIDDVILGCVNQAGEDNRNVARMSLLLGGLAKEVGGMTVNRLCGSGLEAINVASRGVKSGDGNLYIAGGVENMTRAPFVMGKSVRGFSRNLKLYDTTIGWRFINSKLQHMYGSDSMAETAENVAEEYKISRQEQDKYACESQRRALQARNSGRLDEEIMSIEVIDNNNNKRQFASDEHIRVDTTMEKLSTLQTPFRTNGTVTAGNASGINDGAAIMLVASENSVEKYNLEPLAHIVGTSVVGVEPRFMGIGPWMATEKLLTNLNLRITDIDIFEINEAFASQVLASLRGLGIADDATYVNINGGAIALGHPLGMSGARIVMSAALELHKQKVDKALCTMCIGVGQGIAMLLERVT